MELTDPSSIEELKKSELETLYIKYNDASEKLTIENTSCTNFGDEDELNFKAKEEIKLMEWRQVLLFQISIFGILSLISIYDLLTAESKVSVYKIHLILNLVISFVLWILFFILKPKNEVIFTLTKQGVIKNDILYEWNNTNFLSYHRKGTPHLLIKRINEKEIIIPLYFLRYFPSRIICWIERYKRGY